MFTVTFTLLATLAPPKSLIVTVNVYAPEPLKFAVVAFAAFVPFAENVGALTPFGTVVAAQV
jgi:hypothetical protein